MNVAVFSTSSLLPQNLVCSWTVVVHTFFSFVLFCSCCLQKRASLHYRNVAVFSTSSLLSQNLVCVDGLLLCTHFLVLFCSCCLQKRASLQFRNVAVFYSSSLLPYSLVCVAGPLLSTHLVLLSAEVGISLHYVCIEYCS